MKISPVLFLLVTIFYTNLLFADMADITGPTTATEGSEITFSAEYGANRVYTWKIDGEIKLTVTGINVFYATFNDNGEHTISLEVNNPNTGSTDSADHSITITNAPPESLVKVSATELMPSRYKVTMSFSDPGIEDTHTFTVRDSSQLITSGTSIPYEAQADHTFSFSHLYDRVGSHNLTVTVEDDDGGYTSFSFYLYVQNYAPSVTVDVPDLSISGEQIKLTAQIYDPNYDEELSIMVNWGDSSIPNSVSNYTSSVYSATHRYSSSGTYEGFIRVSDSQASDTKNFTVNVFYYKPVFTIAPTYYVQEGEDFVLNVPFVGLDDAFDVSIDWGDNKTTNYTTTSHQINQTHVYNNPGEFSLEATVSDGTLSSTFYATVIVKAIEPLNIQRAPMVTSWEAVPGKLYKVYFSDDEGENFYLMGKTTEGYMLDYGDNDGYDNISGTDDDRPAPSEVPTRLYKVE